MPTEQKVLGEAGEKPQPPKTSAQNTFSAKP